MTAAHDEFDGRAPQAVPADPCAMVIFGANGDLTKRKLMPALLNLRRQPFISWLVKGMET